MRFVLVAAAEIVSAVDVLAVLVKAVVDGEDEDEAAAACANRAGEDWNELIVAEMGTGGSPPNSSGSGGDCGNAPGAGDEEKSPGYDPENEPKGLFCGRAVCIKGAAGAAAPSLGVRVPGGTTMAATTAPAPPANGAAGLRKQKGEM